MWKSCNVGVGGLRCGCGKRLHNVVYAVVGVLEFHRHGAHDVVDVHGVGLEGVRGGFDFRIRIEVDFVDKRGKLSINCFYQLFDSLCEEFLRYEGG